MINRQWRLCRRPTSSPAVENLEFSEAPVATPADGEVLVRNIYLSLDPSNRLWMSEREQYMPPVALGDVMRGITLAVVEQTRSDRLAVGDIVMATAGWEDFSVLSARAVQKLQPVDGVPLSAYLSVLGPTGLTAYFGVTDIARPQAGEVMVVSAAAGAVGSLAGQIGKILGCRVVGIAGGPDKCRWLTETLGFDGAIDYRAGSVAQRLDTLCPDGVDIDFENVGGEIMEAVYGRLRLHGRLVLCGMISAYQQEGGIPGPRDFSRVLMQRLSIRGFIVTDYLARSAEAADALSRWIGEGRLQWRDEIVPGLEHAPTAMHRLFTGDHQGKLMVAVSAPPDG